MKTLLVIIFTGLLAFPAMAWEYISSETVYTEKFDNISAPTDIVFKDAANWLVYSAYDGGIYRYQDGRKSRIYQSKALEKGMCLVETGGYYYYCDSANHRLVALNSDFSPAYAIYSEDGQRPFDPTDVLAKNENLYVVDNDNHQILHYQTGLSRTKRIIGSHGTARGFFRYPFSLVVDEESYVYVTEVLNTRLQMIAPNGQITFQIGTWGVEPGQLYRPKGLAMVNGYLVVSDGYLGVLQLFDVRGNFIGLVTDPEGNIKRYSSPTRIRSHGNLLAVIDYYDYTLEIIELRGLE